MEVQLMADSSSRLDAPDCGCNVSESDVAIHDPALLRLPSYETLNHWSRMHQMYICNGIWTHLCLPTRSARFASSTAIMRSS